jgi:2-haloacid dehalogenase
MRYAAYVFDAYGTLFDVHAAVRRHAARIGADAQALSDLWRAKQLEYSWVRSMMGAYRDFWTLTEEALDFALARYPSNDPRLRDALLDAYRTLDCYAEVPAILKTLKASGARIAILSNGSPAMLEAAVRSAALETVVDEVLSVDGIRRYKADPAVYDMAVTTFRIYPQAVSFQSSNRWDVAGATRFGFRTVWINRTGQPDEYRDFPPSLILPSLHGLATG